MTTVLDTITGFLNMLGDGVEPLPPMSGTLDGHVPDLHGLARDDQGIICQLQDDKSLDGGDSAHRTGVAAFCNSALDNALLPRFESGGVMVPHPTQAPWNNWKNCSRDQLKGYVAGCWRVGRLDINQRLLQAHAARIPPFTCQNTEEDAPGTTKIPPIGDILLPDDVMFLRIVAGENAAYTDAVGQFFLQAAIERADLESLIDGFVEQLGQVFMLRVFHVDNLLRAVWLADGFGWVVLDWWWEMMAKGAASGYRGGCRRWRCAIPWG